MNKGLRLSIISFFAFLGSVIRAEINGDEAFVSPDGRFSASGFVRIVDNSSGEEARVPVLPPILSLEWTGDSKTILAISHLAGGSYAVLLHFDGKSWKKTEVAPPHPSDPPFLQYEVVKRDVKYNKVSLTYSVRLKEHSFQPFKIYFYSCEIDPSSNKRARENTVASPGRIK